MPNLSVHVRVCRLFLSKKCFGNAVKLHMQPTPGRRAETGLPGRRCRPCSFFLRCAFQRSGGKQRPASAPLLPTGAGRRRAEDRPGAWDGRPPLHRPCRELPPAREAGGGEATATVFWGIEIRERFGRQPAQPPIMFQELHFLDVQVSIHPLYPPQRKKCVHFY